MILDIPDIDIKPYVRMTRKGMWVSEQAQEYLASKGTLSSKIKEQMNLQGIDILPAKTPLKISITVYVHTSQGHRADVDNIGKAVLDSCNGIVYPDDRWVDVLDIKRIIGNDRHLCLCVEPLE